MSTITVKDGTPIYYKDWGKGPVVTLSHGWPLSSDAWDGQMLFLARNGFRLVAHDAPIAARRSVSSQLSAWRARPSSRRTRASVTSRRVASGFRVGDLESP